MGQTSDKWLPQIPDPDRELVRAAQAAPKGDLRAFERLMTRYQKQVVANCRYITRDPNNAEDLAQEVFVKAFFGLHNLDGSSSFVIWLQRLKITHCLAHIEKDADPSFVRIEDSEEEDCEHLQVQPAAQHLTGANGDNLIGGAIGAVLDSMPSTLRIPLLLCDMDGLPYEEVARCLGIGLSATKMRIKRGRQFFRERYQRL
jgi:RNA polymerase sigma-70 factor, ECF subfamily